MAIPNSDLATHWGVSSARLSQLRRDKAMPEFSSLAEADSWRAKNAPPRGSFRQKKQAPQAPAQPPAGHGFATIPLADEGAAGAQASRPEHDVPRLRASDIAVDKNLPSAERTQKQAIFVQELAYNDVALADPEQRRFAIIAWSEAVRRGSEAETLAIDMAKAQRVILERSEAEYITAASLNALDRRLDKVDAPIAANVQAALGLDAAQAMQVRNVVREEIDRLRRQVASAVAAIAIGLANGGGAPGDAPPPTEVVEAGAKEGGTDEPAS